MTILPTAIESISDKLLESIRDSIFWQKKGVGALFFSKIPTGIALIKKELEGKNSISIEEFNKIAKIAEKQLKKKAWSTLRNPETQMFYQGIVDLKEHITKDSKDSIDQSLLLSIQTSNEQLGALSTTALDLNISKAYTQLVGYLERQKKQEGFFSIFRRFFTNSMKKMLARKPGTDNPNEEEKKAFIKHCISVAQDKKKYRFRYENTKYLYKVLQREELANQLEAIPITPLPIQNLPTENFPASPLPLAASSIDILDPTTAVIHASTSLVTEHPIEIENFSGTETNKPALINLEELNKLQRKELGLRATATDQPTRLKEETEDFLIKTLKKAVEILLKKGGNRETRFLKDILAILNNESDALKADGCRRIAGKRIGLSQNASLEHRLYKAICMSAPLINVKFDSKQPIFFARNLKDKMKKIMEELEPILKLAPILHDFEHDQPLSIEDKLRAATEEGLENIKAFFKRPENHPSDSNSDPLILNSDSDSDSIMTTDSSPVREFFESVYKNIRNTTTPHRDNQSQGSGEIPFPGPAVASSSFEAPIVIVSAAPNLSNRWDKFKQSFAEAKEKVAEKFDSMVEDGTKEIGQLREKAKIECNRAINVGKQAIITTLSQNRHGLLAPPEPLDENEIRPAYKLYYELTQHFLKENETNPNETQKNRINTIFQRPLTGSEIGEYKNISTTRITLFCEDLSYSFHQLSDEDPSKEDKTTLQDIGQNLRDFIDLIKRSPPSKDRTKDFYTKLQEIEKAKNPTSSPALS